jgi:hypothetical protein
MLAALVPSQGRHNEGLLMGKHERMIEVEFLEWPVLITAAYQAFGPIANNL